MKTTGRYVQTHIYDKHEGKVERFIFLYGNWKNVSYLSGVKTKSRTVSDEYVQDVIKRAHANGWAVRKADMPDVVRFYEVLC